MYGRNKDLTFNNFLQVQEEDAGGFTSHTERPFKRLFLAHITQLEEVCGRHKFHKCFPIAATFHICKRLMPSPPSSKGGIKEKSNKAKIPIF